MLSLSNPSLSLRSVLMLSYLLLDLIGWYITLTVYDCIFYAILLFPCMLHILPI